MQTDADIIVVGAGVAGMAAALDLVRRDMKVAIVEARDRIGGRVYTKQDPLSNRPIELGAEFIHGRPPEILDRLRELNIDPIANSGEDWCEQDGQLTQCDLFSDVDALLAKMRGDEPDESFLKFIRRCCPEVGEETKERAQAYITGFHAADPAAISVHSLVRGMRADEKIEGDRAFRIPGGYAVLIEFFRKRLSTAGVPVRLNTIVREVRWSDHKVVLSCHTDEGHKYFSAPRVLLTLPLGVLQLRLADPGALRFIPDLPQSKKSALSHLAMGKAMRVTLQFRERFWEKVEPLRSKSLARMRFLFSGRKWFPTWWTTMPERRPVITGWAPFHDADELSGQDAAVVFSSACQTLGGLLHLGEQEVEDLVETATFHDWLSDPFSRGAYSYVQAGGDSAQADLATPIEHTLFFAGEAADVSGYHGTVHGAIASGQRAAQQILDQ